jgi:hypothetical protein
MSEYIFRFEHLPNELIIDLFKYFNAEELLHTFYNLNHRFNNLIKSINYLSLTISKENYDQIENFCIFSSYLYTLIIDGYIDLNLSVFNKIRRLIINATDKLLAQFDNCTFHNLEHLSTKFVGPTYRISYLYKTIFSNKFPNLKSYYNLGYGTIQRTEGWTQSPSFRILKIGYVESFIFKTILSTCPNLYYLDFGIIIPSRSSSKIESHSNLKQLILRTKYNTWPVNQNLSIFEDLFTCIPNLEKLSIHRRDNISIISKSFIKYDWLSSILNSYFPLLHRFYCYFHIFQVRNSRIVVGPHLKNILNQIMDNFQNVYKNRYQARLIID